MDRERWDIEHIHAVNSQLPDDVEDLRIVIEALKKEFSEEIFKNEDEAKDIYVSEDLIDRWRKYCDCKKQFEKNHPELTRMTKGIFTNAPFTIKKEEQLFEVLKKHPELEYREIEKAWDEIKKEIKNIHKACKDCLERNNVDGDQFVHNGIDNLTLLDYTTNRQYKDAPFELKRKTIIERERQGQFIPLCTKNVFLKFYSNDPKNVTMWGEQDRKDYLEEIARVLTGFLSNRNNSR